jgi:hypothetical protein
MKPQVPTPQLQIFYYQPQIFYYQAEILYH